MKIIIYLLLALLLSNVTLFAQTNSKINISGKLTDEKQQPFPFVNVLLLKASDSSLVKGSATDDNGAYLLEDLSSGKYLTLVSMVGYEKYYSKVFKIDKESILLPTIKLNPETQSLSEVTVVAKKPFIEQQIDRTVLNVENSIVSAGATALEILERAPGVTVDHQNEELKLRGKNGVTVQIDGKKTYLSQNELINLLRNTPSDNIEKIELITNPSAKYDASGNSGIINIKMKRNKNYGTNGNLSLGAAWAKYGRENATVTINHRAGKLSTFISGGTLFNKGFNNNDIYRIIPYEDQITIFDQRTERITQSQNHNVRAGLDFFATEKTTIGVLVSAFYNSWDNPIGQTNSNILDQDLNLTERYRTNIVNGSNMKNYTTNLNFKHLFDEKGKEITFDIDYVGYNTQSNSNLETRYYFPNGEQRGNSEQVRNDMPSHIKIGVAKIDYAQPLWKGNFETGLKSSYVKTDNNMVFEIKNDDWVVDPNRTNQFLYTENVNAAYLNYNGKISKKMSFQLGLRAEQTQSSGNSVTLNSVKDRNYLNFFPSVFLSHQLDTNNVINLSYSRRIDRPNYQSLNPFEYYLDPYTFSRGNPNLKPQYTHSFQMIHIFKNFLNTTFAYSRIKDLIAGELPQQIASENKTFVTSENLDHQDNFSLTVSLPIPIKRWWNLQTNLSGIYNNYQSFYLDEQLQLSQLSWNVYANNQFTIKNDWTAELSGWYNSKSYYGLYYAKPMGMVNVGLQKKILDKKGSIRLNINDIFWTNKFRGVADYKDINFAVKSQWPSRQIRITFSYSFGNQNVKGARNRNTGADDIQKRVGSE